MRELKEHELVKRRHKALFDEFNNNKSIFEDLRDYINPNLGFFESETPNSGKRRDTKLIRSTTVKYNHILAAGMQWGITSPTRPWVKYALPDDALMQRDDVRFWLEARKNITLDVLSKSNFYPSNHQFYLELGCFGNGAMLIEEDAETAINCRTFTCGEYAFGLDRKGRPNSFARNVSMTIYQIIEEFGIDNVPDSIKNSYNAGQYDDRRDVKHLICPNPDYESGKLDYLSKKFADYYWMDGCKDGKWLKRGGFDTFPVMIERWQVNSGDIYGNGPGHWSLGDAKELQLIATNIAMATELAVKPPTQVPFDVLKNSGVNLLPGGVTPYNPMTGSDGMIKPILGIQLDIDKARELQMEIEESIKQHFNTPVFQLLSDMEKGTRTAREVIELASEKMSQMGPLLERLQTGYLPQVIERVDALCELQGLFPPPPEDIQGMEIKVEYVSILSQAQKQYLITPMMDTVGSVIDMATNAQLPEILDKIDWDEVVDQHGMLNGVPPSVIVSDERVAQIRQARAEEQAKINAAQMGMNAAQAAKTLSQADMSGDSALTQILGGPAGGLQQ